MSKYEVLVSVSGLALGGILFAGAIWMFIVMPARWHQLYLRRFRGHEVSLLSCLFQRSRADTEELLSKIGDSERRAISAEAELAWVDRLILWSLALWAVSVLAALGLMIL